MCPEVGRDPSFIPPAELCDGRGGGDDIKLDFAVNPGGADLFVNPGGGFEGPF